MKYSVDEIDLMRKYVHSMLFAKPGSPYASDPEFSAMVEDHLRTYMRNGTTPEELRAKTGFMPPSPDSTEPPQ